VTAMLSTHVCIDQDCEHAAYCKAQKARGVHEAQRVAQLSLHVKQGIR